MESILHRALIAISAILFSAGVALAVPAERGVRTYTQPDGTRVSVELHGDEFFSWTTFAGSDRLAVRGDDGFWRESIVTQAFLTAREEASRRRASAHSGAVPGGNHAPRFNSVIADQSLTTGYRRIPVILVQFQDVPFRVNNPAAEFDALFNEAGYSANGATGSVRDYYMENSRGLFSPQFDIFGPVTLPENMAYYGEPVRDEAGNIIKNDRRPEVAVYDACRLVDGVVDFSRYDYNYDGAIDVVVLIYAGHGQNSSGLNESIWPHEWDSRWSSYPAVASASFDGKKLGVYSCTAELMGENVITGIGPSCHEFGHTLGLPDFYDTDGSENGSCSGLYKFSLMSAGNYNNSWHTPPYLNYEERRILGWMKENEIKDIVKGENKFTSIKDNVAYRTTTSTEGEYFVYECRDHTGWDEPIPGGMLVFHVDRSSSRVLKALTPAQYWDMGLYINIYGDHPCFYVVPAIAPSNLHYIGPTLSNWMFPLKDGKDYFTPVDWEGNATDIWMVDIKYSSETVSLLAKTSSWSPVVSGTITSEYGKPLTGAHVAISPPDTQASDGGSWEGVYGTDTNNMGEYSIRLNGFDWKSCHIKVSKEGYIKQERNVALSSEGAKADFVLMESDENIYGYYDRDGNIYSAGDGVSMSLMAAIRIPSSKLPKNGGWVKSVSFMPLWAADAYYIIVDSGTRRIITKPTSPTVSESAGTMMTVNIPGEADSAWFSPSEDLYIGYAVKNAQIPPEYGNYQGYLFASTMGSGNLYLSPFDMENSEWERMMDGRDLVLEATATPANEPPQLSSLSQLGMVSITEKQDGAYHAGDAFPLSLDLPQGASPSVRWLFDGVEVTDSVTLRSGRHTVVAVLTDTGGDTERISLVIDVE